MIRRLAAVLLIAGLWPGANALAQEFKPYPSPRITVEQWQQYLATVRARFETTAEVYKDKNVVVFSDDATRTVYVFTTRKHPAHPAWITSQVVKEGDQLKVRQIGFFAGAQEPFDQLFTEHLAMHEQMKQNVERRNQ